MSSRKERNAAELRAKAAAAQIEMNRLLQKAEDELKKERARRERRERGEPPSHEEVEEEKEEEERIKRKSGTVFGKLKSVFRRRSKSRSRSPPPGYAPPAYSRDATTGGTKRGKKTKRMKKTKRRRTIVKRRK